MRRYTGGRSRLAATIRFGSSGTIGCMAKTGACARGDAGDDERGGKRRAMRSRGRVRWTAGKLGSFVRDRGYWPSGPELAESLGRGSRITAWRDLALLERAGFVARVGRRWAMTEDGWRWLEREPIAPRYARKPRKRSRKEEAERLERRRADAFVALERPLLESRSEGLETID